MDHKDLMAMADQGDAEAQYRLGRTYLLGDGPGQDLKEAAKWTRRAADQRHTEAQYQLGWMHAQGDGVDQDYDLAAKWYRRAAERGHPQAQYNLGLMCARSRGGDPKETIKWHRLAAVDGHDGAQYNLGRIYYFGEGVDRDLGEAAKWYQRAAVQWLPLAVDRWERMSPGASSGS